MSTGIGKLADLADEGRLEAEEQEAQTDRPRRGAGSRRARGAFGDLPASMRGTGRAVEPPAGSWKPLKPPGRT